MMAVPGGDLIRRPPEVRGFLRLSKDCGKTALAGLGIPSPVDGEGYMAGDRRWVGPLGVDEAMGQDWDRVGGRVETRAAPRRRRG